MIGNYHLIVKFGDQVLPLSTSVLRELTNTQDMNKLVPEFRLRIDDATGALTHLLPFDKSMSNVYIELALDSNLDTIDKNAFEFMVYIREPSGTQSTPTTEYDITGLLDVKKLFAPGESRGFSGSMKTTLETIAAELEVDSTEISSSLDYDKNILQPQWTNAQLLNNLQEYLIGSNDEYGFKCFVKNYKYDKIFTFTSLSEMITSPIAYKFILNDTAYEGQLPIYEYYIYDNYKLYGIFGIKSQDYSYFDYTNSVYTNLTENVADYTSLSDFFAIDKDDTTDNNEIIDNGRSTDFTRTSKGKVKSSYGNKLVGLVKMWITTQGLPNAVPGQTIQIFFPHGVVGDNLYSYQYSGYWLVERVVHNLGDVFLTKLLLTRHGIDTDKDTTLTAATTKKRQA